jgi:hypothetical protein
MHKVRQTLNLARFSANDLQHLRFIMARIRGVRRTAFSRPMIKKQQGLDKRLSAIWRLDPRLAPWQLRAYGIHIKALRAITTQLPEWTRVDSLNELLSFLKGHGQSSVGDIVSRICRNSPDWLPKNVPEKAATAAVEFGLRLWLFITPDLRDKKLTLAECAKKGLLGVNSHGKKSAIETLSRDFSEQSLTDKGGMTIVPTSNLSEHLTFEAEKRLCVFRHGSVLGSFNRQDAEEL